MRGIFKISTLLIAAILSSPVLAWGPDGHRASGEIAWQLLDGKARAEVARLLRVKGESSLAEAGTWADRIRSNDRYNWAAPLHYINLPVGWETYEPSRDCPVQGCILQAIETYRSQLTDKSLGDQERAEALLFLVHFVEDIHQPMHTGLRDDRGGNDVKVTFYGFDTNLHALWDTYLPAGFVGDWRAFATAQVDRITGGELATPALDTPVVWAEESHRLAHTNAYTENATLGEDYYSKNRPVAELRLRQGGVRLAALLNRILGETERG